MATMSNYCKAYPASQLREYAGWLEQVPPLVVTAADATPEEGERTSAAGEPAREEYYYLHDNYVVTAGVFVDEAVAFDLVTDEWKRFCCDHLAFDVPPEARDLDNETPPGT